MSKRNFRRKRQQNGGPLKLAGIGAILIAAALFLMSWGSRNGSNPQAPSREMSVVPASVDIPAPELSLESLNGNPEALVDYRQNVVLVNNWATWCPPCKAEMPTLEGYYQAHSADGLMIVAIEAGDSRENVQEFTRTYGLTFPVWLDPNGASLAAFSNSNLPNSYVIDRSGRIRYAWTGQINREMLEKYVTPLLTENN